MLLLLFIYFVVKVLPVMATDNSLCSFLGTFKMLVDYGKTYLLRIINAVMNEEMFLMIVNHNLTLVGTDGSYTKPLITNYIMITPGQTMDLLLMANQTPSHYYMAARAYSSGQGVAFDNTTTTGILQYSGNYTPPLNPLLPNLPDYNDTTAATNFTTQVRSLGSVDHPIDVPKRVHTKLYVTVSVNTLPCPNNSCTGPGGTRLSASLNNQSFVTPSIDILSAYYERISGVFKKNFPRKPPYPFNYTGDNLSSNLSTPNLATKVRMLRFNTTVEIVFQGTNLIAAENHPMHLHGYSFYVVGFGFGNFNNVTDPKSYNLDDPPERNTVGVPINGWVAIRFRANNPGSLMPTKC